MLRKLGLSFFIGKTTGLETRYWKKHQSLQCLYQACLASLHQGFNFMAQASLKVPSII